MYAADAGTVEPCIISPWAQAQRTCGLGTMICQLNASLTFFVTRLATTTRFLIYFFAPIIGLPAIELAVADIFGFSFFGFFVSFLLFLPLAIVCPSKMQRSNAQIA